MENQSYAFMARKFLNLRFKKNQPFRSKPPNNSFNKGKAPKKAFKGGDKASYVDKYIVRCFHFNEKGNFSNDCRSLKYKDKAYLDLKSKWPYSKSN